MKKLLLFSVLSVLFSAGATAQQDIASAEIKTTDLGDGIHLLQGRGGNVLASTGADGLFVIDSDFKQLSAKVRAALAKLSDKPVSYLVNTHWHSDHTGGNTELKKAGALIFAHDNVRSRLMASPDTASFAPPVITYSDSATFHLNGHEIHAYHIAGAHTDGDTVVHFKDINLVHTGDIFFNGLYPYVDLKSGGSVDGYIRAQKRILSMVDAKTKIVPGHGPLATRKDLKKAAKMLATAKKRVAKLVRKKKSLEQIKAANPLADYEKEYSWRFISNDFMLEILYRDLTAK